MGTVSSRYKRTVYRKPKEIKLRSERLHGVHLCNYRLRQNMTDEILSNSSLLLANEILIAIIRLFTVCKLNVLFNSFISTHLIHTIVYPVMVTVTFIKTDMTVLKLKKFKNQNNIN